MKKIIAMGALLVTPGDLAPITAQAGAAANVALGLASFAVFNQLLGGFYAPRVRMAPYYAPYHAGYYYAGYSPPVAYPAPVVTHSQTPLLSYAPPAPQVQNKVVYPHGKYVLGGDGVTTAYQWVWISNPPPAHPQESSVAIPPTR